ncbi:MAG: TlpA disulfide reductase family protein, partial [Rhodanobacteraceae bacterium]
MRRIFNNTNLLILAIAVVGATAGYVIGGWLQKPTQQTPREPAAARVGELRPDLTLPDLDGRSQTLSRWNGKLVLLNFWASWCTPCRAEMPLLQATQQAHAADGLQIIGVAIDDAAAARGFLRAHPVDYPVLIDAPENTVDSSEMFGNNRALLPYSVLIGPDRRVLAARFGSFTAASLDAWLAPHLGQPAAE